MIRSSALKDLLIAHSSMIEGTQLQEANRLETIVHNCEEACPEESREEQLELFLRTILFSRRPKLLECFEL